MVLLAIGHRIREMSVAAGGSICQLRAALYSPLLAIEKAERGRVVDAVLAILLKGEGNAEE